MRKLIPVCVNSSTSILNELESYTNNATLPKSAAFASYLKDRYRNKWIWNLTSQSWYTYQKDLGIWVELKAEKIQTLVQRELDSKPETRHNYSCAYVRDILSLLKGHLSEENWDSRQDLIPLKNGVLDFKSKTLLNHSSDYRFTWRLPYDYSSTATCEPIQKWLLETMQGDEQLVQLLRAYMNAVVKGRSDLQRFLECVGEGGTGKSTFANLVIALVGIPNTLSTSLKTLETNRFESANLLGKRLVYVADSERYTRNASKLKALTGQDQIRYEKKHVQGGHSFRFDGMVLIVANETINFNDFTSGIQRRRITVPFNNRVKPEKRRNLIEVSNGFISGEFAPYLPGLLNWVLEMPDDKVTDLLKNTHRSVPSLAMTTAETLIETNPMAAWLDDCVFIDPDAETHIGSKKQPSSTHLYPNYVSFCDSSGYKPVAINLFSSRLVDLMCSQLKIEGVEKKHTRTGNCIVGLRLRTDSDIVPRPITGVTNASVSGEVSQSSESTDTEGSEECEGAEDNSSLTEEFAIPF